MKKRWIIIIGLVVAIMIIYLGNASWTAGKPDIKLKLLAHRGVHQTYSHKGMDNDSCSASQMSTPKHKYLENTVASIDEAFNQGAEIVEFDVHPTMDGHFVVFHDWRLECRTNGKGVTREQNLAYLKTLDIGYGYTADGGKTFPFRGKGQGLMPTLDEVLDQFPSKRFLIHIKSRDPKEGEQLANALSKRSIEQQALIVVYGSEEAITRFSDRMPKIRVFTKSSIKKCLKRYAMLGWSGYFPDVCRNIIIAVPINWAPYLWGWPWRFIGRFAEAGSEVILFGPADKRTGIDDLESLTNLIEDYRGLIWTNRIELIGPAVKSQIEG